jgi:hypothetical protein
LPADNHLAQFEKARSRAAYFSNSEKIAAQLPGFFAGNNSQAALAAHFLKQ